ncbi:hypothetical protein [Modestobacter sp. SYSU DS0657]
MSSTSTLPTSTDDLELRMETSPPPTGFAAAALGGDRIRLLAVGGGEEVELAELDGRHWSAEAAVSFTGRVLGLYAVEGTVAFSGLRSPVSGTPAPSSSRQPAGPVGVLTLPT